MPMCLSFSAHSTEIRVYTFCFTPSQNYTFWTGSYAKFQAGKFDASALGLRGEIAQAEDLFPRYLVWKAILDEVERIDLRLPYTMEQMRRALITAATAAKSSMTSNPKLSRLAYAAMADGRGKFELAVRSFSGGGLHDVEPLEPRRVFGAEELQQVWARLRSVWDVSDEYWWPLRRGCAPPDVVAFHADWFDGEKVACLREILISSGVDLIWEVRECHEWGCERSVNALDPRYTGEEGYWTSANMSWLVYASHESSITIAGRRLTGSFCRRFPKWELRTYGGSMSTPDKRRSWVF